MLHSFLLRPLPAYCLRGGAPDIMNFFHHGAVLERVLDRVWVMRTGHFKKFLKVVFGYLSLPLEIMFDSHYKPLIRVVRSPPPPPLSLLAIAAR
jgi:hypothetical protein